jgi:hypothetical protein
MLQDELNQSSLATLVAPGPFEVMVFQLINVSRQNGWTDKAISQKEYPTS